MTAPLTPATRRYAPLETIGDRLRFAAITSFGLGLAPVASGTWGTFGGVALAFVAQWSVEGVSLVAVLWGLALLLGWWGCLQSGFVNRVFLVKDPGAFVLDEVVGYLIAVALFTSIRGPMDTWDHALMFLGFRAFDVLKIQPARRLESLPGAWGIMLDDMVAGLYAGAVYVLVGPYLS